MITIDLFSISFWTNVIGPFLVVFSMMYGLLRKSRIMGDPREKRTEKLYMVVSLVLALYFIVSVGVLEKAQKLVSAIFYEILFILLLLLAISIFTPASNNRRKQTSDIIVGLVGLGFFLAIWYGLKTNPSGTVQYTNNVASSLTNIFIEYIINTGAYIVIVLLLAMWVMYRWFVEEGEEQQQNRSRRIDINKVKELLEKIEDISEETLGRSQR